jgi:hypothetical protein
MDERRDRHENENHPEQRETGAGLDREQMRITARRNELRERAQNELLQQKLSAMEEQQGSVLDEQEQLARFVELGDLEELDELVRLAAAVRGLPHPIPEAEASRIRQQQILAEGKRRTMDDGRTQTAHGGQAAQKSKPTQPVLPDPPKTAAPDWPVGGPRTPVPGRQTFAGPSSQFTSDIPTGERPSTVRRPSSIVIGLSLLALSAFLILAVSLTGLGLYLAGPRGAQAAVLMDLAGQVEVQGADGAWLTVKDGDRIKSGERLRTGAASQATLAFFDGTRTTLKPGSDVTLSSVGGSWGRSLRVSLTQHAGKTQSSVVPLRGSKSAFTVLTPSGVASVHGTTFDVAVDTAGRSRFGVSTGRVLVSSEASEVFLTSGQATTALPEGGLETPSYQFNLQGILSSREGSTWIVTGVPFTVLPETSIPGDLKIGAEVIVVGRVLATGEWIADSVEPAPAGGSGVEKISSFTGMLESNSGEVWMVAGWSIKVDSSTVLAAGLQVGAPVQVAFKTMDDGRWLALRIEPLQEPGENPLPTPDPDAQPILSFRPEALKEEVCGDSLLNLTGALVNTADGADDAAAGVELAYQVVEGAGFVDWVELSPAKWDRIQPGDAVSFNLRLALKGGWGEAEGQEIKLRVFVMNGPPDTGTRLTVKVENVCEATRTPTSTPEASATLENTATPTAAPTATATPQPTATGTVTATLPVTATQPITITATPTITETTDAASIHCTGAQPHPTGMRLSIQYGVPYEEIMSWFCQGFGFGEIDHAYSLSLQSGVPVAEIFAMKSSGMGWGEIKKQLEGGPGNSNNNGNPKKQNDPAGPPAQDQPGNGKPDKPKRNKP